MDEKLIKTIPYKEKTFEFSMTNHLESTGNLDVQLTTICDWLVVTAADETNWFIDLQWCRIIIPAFAGFRIAPISPIHPLFNLLDQPSQRSITGNWLIFKGHVLTDSQINVTHFGPFGWKKKKNFEQQLHNLNKTFKKLLQKFKISAAFPNSVSSQKTTQQFKGQLSCLYQKIKKDIERNLEKKKQKLEEISKEIFGVEEGIKIAAEIAACITKAVTKEVLRKSMNLILKEISEIVAKQIAKEIAKITAKNGAKEAGKMGVKKIPVAGLIVGGVFAIGRLFTGDIRGAGLELVSGAASTVPGVGTALSLAIDVGIAALEIGEAVDEIKVIEF